jgi:hypothetical protein
MDINRGSGKPTKDPMKKQAFFAGQSTRSLRQRAGPDGFPVIAFNIIWLALSASLLLIPGVARPGDPPSRANWRDGNCR